MTKYCKNKCFVCRELIIVGHSYKRGYCSEECFNKSHTPKNCILCGETYRSSQRGLICPSCRNNMCVISAHPLAQTYLAMLYRCYSSSRNVYSYYGEKGIKVSEEWLNFANFCKDMGERPQGYTLDRIDNAKNYSKNNCRWVTIEEQRINRGRFKNTKRKYKGVGQQNIAGGFQASVRHKGETLYLGTFSTEGEAAEAYNQKIRELYPETYEQYINKI